MNSLKNRNVLGTVAILILTALSGSACAQKAASPTPPTPTTTATSPGEQAALERFKALGKGAPLTVVPARLAGTPMKQVGEVVAMMLERSGMTNLETSDTVFTPPENADLAQTARAFAEFIQTNPPTTEYALFADFFGSPQKGVDEVRAVIASKQGDIVWQDRQTPGDKAFDAIKPREPMQCCQLVVERLRPVLGLGDPTSENAPTGKLAQRWEKQTGVPDKAELAAIEQRTKAFKAVTANSTLLVYPAHAGDGFSGESAMDIATRINDGKLMKAIAAETGPQLKVAPNMNEQKVLWGMARAFSDYVKKNPPTSDYVLYADYLMGKGAVGGVHFAICDKQGELVIVDFQNSHWPDFKSINPKSRQDCDRLVAKRLEGYCK